MNKLLIGVVALLLLSGAARAEEIWQTLPKPPAMPTPVESGMAPVNDIQMYYAVYGEGEPVLLIHGGLGNADVWGFQVPALAESHKVIVADSRGHGRSTRSDEAVRLSADGGRLPRPCSITWESTRWRWSAGATAASSGSTSRSVIPSG